MHTVEQFVTRRWAAATPAEPEPTGSLFILTVPSGLRRRILWLAAGAFLQTADNDYWFTVCKLNFRRRGTNVGSFEFTDCAAYMSAAVRAMAPRTLNRIKPDGTGSAQPSLQFREVAGVSSNGRDNCDLAAFDFTVDCNEIQFEVEKTLYGGSAVNPFCLLFGMKIVSL